MDKAAEDKDKIFKLIQEYLKPCPTIIWGSGGTIPFGMPSMQKLKEHLKITEEGDIEDILNNLIGSDKQKYNQYKSQIFEFINNCDKKIREKIRKDTSILQPLNSIIRFCYDTHPEKVDIITTNYDCVLEYCLSINEYSYSDGYSGREFSNFDDKNFKTNCINLFKVHGSLRWGEQYYSYFNEEMKAIYPTNHKYQDSHKEPFRTLLHKSDSIISKTKSILSIGFGFNDEHLTPKIDQFIERDGKIVIIAKEATAGIKKKVKKANKFILIEGGEENKTKFSYKEGKELKNITLDGNFWDLTSFVSIISNNT